MAANETQLNIRQLEENAQKALQVQTFTLKDGTELLSVPEQSGQTRRIVDPRELMEPYLDNPRRRSGFSQHHTEESFCAIVNRFKVEYSVIYADKWATRLIALFDYHEENEAPATRKKGEGDPAPLPAAKAPALAHFLEHGAEYKCPLSDQWKAWTNAEGKWMDQSAFAEFLEDRILDVISPNVETMGARSKQIQEALGGVPFGSPHRILELSRGLKVRVGMSISNESNTSSGECNLTYKEEHAADEKGAALNIPQLFLIGIPVFDEGQAYQITVRIRYRIRQQQISWKLELQQKELMLGDAFQGVVTKVRSATGLPVFFGLPEPKPEHSEDDDE